jgi:hypothetical protein
VPLARPRFLNCRDSDFARIPAAFRFDWHFLWLAKEMRLGCRGGLGRRMLGLERFEEPQGAPQLGQRRAAIAQERIERPRAVAIADQGHTGIPLAPQMVLEQPGLDVLGALEPPGGPGDAPGEQGLQGAIGCQLLDQRRLERGELPAASRRRRPRISGRENRASGRSATTVAYLPASWARAIWRRCGGSPRRARRTGRCPWDVLEDGEGWGMIWPVYLIIGTKSNAAVMARRTRRLDLVNPSWSRVRLTGPCDRGNPCPRRRPQPGGMETHHAPQPNAGTSWDETVDARSDVCFGRGSLRRQTWRPAGREDLTRTGHRCRRG